jgi:chromosome segregation ATPase
MLREKILSVLDPIVVEITVMAETVTKALNEREAALAAREMEVVETVNSMNAKNVELAERERVVAIRERQVGDVQAISAGRFTKIKTLEQNQNELLKNAQEAEARARAAEKQKETAELALANSVTEKKALKESLKALKAQYDAAQEQIKQLSKPEEARVGVLADQPAEPAMA